MQKLGFPLEWMNELKSRNDIASVVARYVHLQPKGKRLWGCCPFHIEKTPSFTVSAEEGFFKCFGCGEGGDVVSFVQKIERIDFPKAIELLASWANMQVPSFEGNEEILLRAKKKEKVLNILEETKKFFISNLEKPNAKNAIDYIARRGLSKQDLQKFEIGVSLDWNGLVNHLKQKGFTPEEMKEAGVVEIKDGHPYDVMAERLCFPIMNSIGECIAFSARILVPSDFAKYKNTSDTIVFHKSKSVFGIHLIKKLKHEKGLSNIVLVEGQMDVIAMHQAGFENTVACMGTAITPEHAKELKKFSENIILCMDGDSAGRKAALKSIDIFKSEGLFVKVAALGEGGKDPDEFIKTKGKAEMQRLLDEALPANDYKIVSLSQDYDLSEPSQNARFVEKAKEIIKSFNTLSERDIYTVLLSKISKVPVDILRRDIGSNSVKTAEQIKTTATKLVNSNPVEESIKFILFANLSKESYASLEERFGQMLNNNDERVIFDYLMECKLQGRKPQVSAVFDLLGNENEYVKELLNINLDLEEVDFQKKYDDCMWKVIESKLLQQQQDLFNEHKNIIDNEERKKITQKIQEIAQNLKKKNWREIL